ncbi:MAG: hypothetical protein DWP98_07695 [Bacteroidetes bacterium]|nr:MAG: hypothetical protein DWP98_07695 [Bacteroidota bacterium]MBL1145376.1 hypothetical protein [Bacteroidota bacterium]NOG58174.1 hypothetical protein [Bacteroidota bacterium]
MKIRLLSLFLILFIAACNPYKGFKGVSKKGMKTSTTPSQELRDDYKSSSKKMNRRYKREMKRNKKRLGHSE